MNPANNVNNQTTIPVGKMRTKHRKNVLSTKKLLQNFANEQKANSNVKKSKKSQNIEKQEPAFKLLNLEAESINQKI